MILFGKQPWIIPGTFVVGLTIFCSCFYDKYTLIRILALLIALGLFTVHLKKSKLKVNLFVLSLLVLAIFELGSIAWAYSTAHTLKNSFLTLLSFLLILVFSQRDYEQNMKFLLPMSSLVLGLHLIFAMYSIASEGWEPYGIHGLSMNKNLFAGFILLSLPLIVIARMKAKRKWIRLLFLVLITLSLMLLAFIQSRSVYLSILLTSALVLMIDIFHRVHYSKFLILGKLKPYFYIPLILIIGSVAYFLLVNDEIREDFTDKIRVARYFSKVDRESLTEVTEDNYKSIETRKILWKSSLEMVKERPMLGTGKGNWSIAVGKHATSSLPDTTDREQGLLTHPQ